ncbi:LytTR family DNA-binding domain-containing protein [Thioclava sp. FR2]|uniref:LytTR family DNA-binding domain-containing protein n=1 Tax=Thioclava sp. FR2 TaxID=3445780 RepID=UPI003EB6DE87
MFLVGSVYVTQRMGRTVYASLVVAVSIILATVYGVISATLLGAQIPPLIDVVLVAIFNLVFGVVGEVIFVSFLVPRILRDIASQPLIQPDYAAKNETIQSPVSDASVSALSDPLATELKQPVVMRDPVINILGIDFRSEDVSVLSAEAHYVSVVRRDGKTKLLRGRISEAADAMPPELGRMVHRSHWVAAHAVDTLVQDGRNHVLLLKDGRRLPVARNRQHEIRNWVEHLSQ